MMAHAKQTDIQISSLKQRADFLHLNKSGKKWVSKSMIVLTKSRDETPHIRFGITITKKIFKSAVKRNRVKRRLRALAQDLLSVHGRAGYDYVLIGRTDTLDKPFTDLKKDLTWCLKKLHNEDR